MSFKIRGFTLCRRSGAPITDAFVMLKATLRHASETKPGAHSRADRRATESATPHTTVILSSLYSDHCGYFSFDLSEGRINWAAVFTRLQRLYLACLCDGSEHTLTLLDDRSPDELRLTLAELPLTHNLFLHRKTGIQSCCGDHQGPRGGGRRSVQNPDLVDWEISPRSFAALPNKGSAGDNCQSFAHSSEAVREYLFHDIIDAPWKGAQTYTVNALVDPSAVPGDGPHELRSALVREYRQTWTPLGHALGDIAYSTTLLPGESVNLAMIEWSRRDTASRLDDVELAESLQHNLVHDRTIDEVVAATLTEEQSGWSVLGGVLAPIPVSEGGPPILAAVGAAYSSTSGVRTLTGNDVQNIADAVVQNSNLSRRLRSTVVVQATQSESNALQTRAIANHNHCHALSVEYYEVLRHLKVTTRYSGSVRAVLVPYRLFTFTEDLVNRFELILRRTLLDPSYAAGFDALRQKRYPDAAPPAPTTPSTPPVDESSKVIRSLTVTVGLGDEGLVGNAGTDVEFLLQWESALIEWKWTPFTNDDFEPGQSYTQNVDLASYDTQNAPGGVYRGQLRKVGIRNKTNLDAWKLNSLSVTWHASDGSSGVLYSNSAIGKDFPGNTGHSSAENLWVDSVVAPAAPTPATPTPTPAAPTGQPGIDCLLDHLNANRVFYNRAIWLLQDPSERALLFESLFFEGQPLLAQIRNRPLAVRGNYVAFPLRDSASAEPTHRPAAESRIVAIPSRGLFAETLLSNCNACEQRDVTRFWDWSEGIVDQPPAITGVQPGPSGQPPSIPQPTLPAQGIQITNVPSVPDPTGLASALTLLGKSDIFRNMSGLDQVQELLDGLLGGSLDLAGAKKKAQAAKNAIDTGSSGSGGKTSPGTRTAPNESDPKKQVDRLGAIKHAQDQGLLTDQQANDAAVGLLGGTLVASANSDLPLPVQALKFGIDVSHHQRTDWDAIVADPLALKFAIIKATGSTQQEKYRDDQFATNWIEARRVGIIRGAYHFYAIDEDAAQQAGTFKDAIDLAGGFKVGDLPPVLDIELTHDEQLAIQHDRARQVEILDDLQIWLDAAKGWYQQATGRDVLPIVYTSKGTWTALGNSSRFSEYPLWVATYGTEVVTNGKPPRPAYRPDKFGGWSRWTIWQYTERGEVNGAANHEGFVDIDLFNGTIEDLWDFAGLPYADTQLE